MAIPGGRCRPVPHPPIREENVNTRYLLLAACAAVACLTVLPLRADEPAAKASTPQREKFAACGHESKGMKGEERREFMSECLKGHGPDTAVHEARDTMAGDAAEASRQHSCAEEADRRKLHGDERRVFMGSCLKG
jgi:psiF repeat